jgi:hypothetical protein
MLIFAAAALPRAVADEWISEEHLCALTIPTQESWTSGRRQALPTGEVIFHGISMHSDEGIMVTFAPDMPTTDLGDPGIQRRVQEFLLLEGWSIESGVQITWKARPFLQFITQRKDAASGVLLGVARATIRAGELFIVTAYGKGKADRVDDPNFMRVMNTFRFIERQAPVVDPATVARIRMYQFGLFGTATAAALLIVAFAVTMFRSRHGTELH